MGRKIDPTVLLPALCLAASAFAISWVVASGTSFTPVFRLGVSLSLMLTFGLIWIFGIRYPDVGWMVVIASVLSLDTLAPPALQAVTRGAMMLAFGCFLRTFFRAQLRAGVLELGFAVAVLALYGGSLLVPSESWTAAGMNGTAETYLGVVLLGYAAVHGFMSLAPLPPKRQRYVAMVVLSCVAAAACYLLVARAAAPGEALRTPIIDFGLALSLAAFLLADLVIFHRNYFKEKTTRIAQPHELTELVARHELGQALQELLSPQGPASPYGEFQVELYFRPAPVMGADWRFDWPMADERRLLLGKITGKGAQAALGVAAVLGFLHQAAGRGLTLDQALRYLNARLLDVFERQLTSTAMAVSLGVDGSVELFNCGGAGFFTVTREGGQHLALNSTPLGVSADLEVGHQAVPLDHLDILFAGTEGLISGLSGARRLLDFFDDEEELLPELAQIRDQVLSLSDRAPDQDDRTLLLVQRRFADGELSHGPAAADLPDASREGSGALHRRRRRV